MRSCGAYLACMDKFESEYPVEFVAAETATLQKSFLI